MNFTSASLPRHRPFATQLAERLLARGADSLPETLVVLPSARAGAGLAFALQKACGRPALLLPRITTVARLVEDLALRLPHVRPPRVPDSVREPVLTAVLAALPWLSDRPETVPGTARELLRLFDELRLHDRDPEDPCPLTAAAPDALRRDRERVREAWLAYRRVIPYDGIDRLRNVVSSAEETGGWPGPPLRRLTAAGFVDLNPTAARVLSLAAGAAEGAELIAGTAAEDDRTSRRFLATWRDPDAPTSPTTPERTVAAILGLHETPPPPDERPLPVRLADLGDPPADDARPEILTCADPEQESLTVASRIVAFLETRPDARVCVATNDRGLARRVAMQLRDAGLTDLDESSGLSLAAEPEGLLVWALLRCVATGPAHEPLLELLAHPLVDFGRPAGLHRRRTLRFERELMRGSLAGVGLEGYRSRAREKDAAIGEGVREMEDLIDDVAAAMDPLPAGRDRIPVAQHVARLREAWTIAAPNATLGDDLEAVDDRTTAARRALTGLLDDLTAADDVLPAMTLGDFSGTLSRLLGEAEVLPRRSPLLPVHITGLLEARLERYDLLILCGMDEDRFPGRIPRPLFLGGAGREAAGLPGWRRIMALQAELFLRLVHNGDEIVVTRPRERDGRPVLPSPFTARLTTALGVEETPAPPPRPYRPVDENRLDPAADQESFRAEPLPAPAHVPPPPRETLSHGDLKTFRACPYRWLLERGYGLREQDEVVERLRKKDMGEIVHDSLARFHGPGGEARALLLAGDRDRALALLSDLAADEFAAKASGLPQRGLWLASFLRTAPEIVAVEIKRAPDWEPVSLEADFALPLSSLRRRLDEDPAGDGGDVRLIGRIDRIDRATGADTGPRYAVLDYKTGRTPGRDAVLKGEDLQLQLYALAVATGCVPKLEAGPVTQAAFYPIALGETKIQGPYLPDAGDMERDEKEILATAERILAADGPYARATETESDREPEACRHCMAAGLCRGDERRLAAELEGAT